MELRSPKRDLSSSHIYGYYAGYSPKFVRDVLVSLNLHSGAIVLDPWNGSGTTTYIAEQMGFTAVGYDINPVMVIVSKARCLHPGTVRSLATLCQDIIQKSLRYRSRYYFDKDPLQAWLMPRSVTNVRNIERAIQQLFIDASDYHLLYGRACLQDMSTLAAFFYTALFRTLRSGLAKYNTSNPTWIKTPKSESDRVSLASDVLVSEFSQHVSKMAETLGALSLASPYNVPHILTLNTGSSEALPVLTGTVDAVISSPPYCTRIDYAVATKPELALLGCAITDHFQDLRRQMIGTPTIDPRQLPIDQSWGTTCIDFLETVSRHRSKASRSYYFKHYVQYFGSIYRSLREIDRTLTQNRSCTLVVQDSYYKDVHNDLPMIFKEMGNSLGWTLRHQVDFKVGRTMAGVNQHAMKYRGTASAVESALVFWKGD